MKPSHDDLCKENERLREKIRILEERLNLNSDNSSKPPSSDQKKNKQVPRGGAKKGHRDHHRKLYSEDQISQRMISSVEKSEHCGCKELKKRTPEIFQQVELPQIKPEVTQIELEKAICCRCKRNVSAPFPKEYAKSSFGPQLISFIGACSSVYRMSKRTIQTFLQTYFKIEISLGSLPAMERRLSKGLELSYNDLAKVIEKRKIA